MVVDGLPANLSKSVFLSSKNRVRIGPYVRGGACRTVVSRTDLTKESSLSVESFLLLEYPSDFLLVPLLLACPHLTIYGCTASQPPRIYPVLS